MTAICARALAIVAAASQLFAAASLPGAEDMSGERPLRIENAGAGIAKSAIRGPQFSASKAFHAFEQFPSPRIKRLREEYALDEVVRGAATEFEKMLALRHWVHARWPIDNEQQFSGDAFEILERAKTGAGFHCSHAMRVQHAVMTAMGFVVRDLGVDCDHTEFGRSIHHGVNEVWSNQHAKWILLDAKYDIHFERDGQPLSALELHEAARADRGAGIVKVQGPERQAVPMKGLEYPTSSVLGYWWVSYHAPLDSFTGSTRDSRLVIFDNDAFRKTTWFRGGADGLKKHWAYAADAFLPTSNRREIEWTPGLPGLHARQVSEGELDVNIESVTPNLKCYEARIDRGPWERLRGDRLGWMLEQGRNVLDLRTRNEFDVRGPVVTAVVMYDRSSAAGNEELPASLAPHFAPPAEFAGDFGDYRSLLKSYDGREFKTADDWKRRREEILDRWHGIMGRWPPLLSKPTIEYLESERRENFMQHRVRVEIGPGGRTVDGFLLAPDGRSTDFPRDDGPAAPEDAGRLPAVVVVYYDAKTGIGLGTELRDFAYQLAKRGFVALSIGTPSTRLYPTEENAQLQPLSWLAYCAANCAGALETLPYVDPQRIGIVGHSYGGKWAMFASCLSEKFACAAWSDGGVVFDEARANVNYWERWYLGYEPGAKRPEGRPSETNPRTGAYRQLVEQGLDLHELHGLMAPRPFLVSGGSEDRPQRWRALNHAIAANKLLGCENRVAMTNRAGHSPTVESNEQIYHFFEHFLRPAEPVSR